MFGAENPVGKVLKFDKNHPYTVQGVFKDIPENCHLQFDVVASFENIKTQFGRNAGWNRDDSYMGYVRLVAGATPEVVEEKIPDLLTIYQDEQFSLDETEQIIYYLEPVSAYHLKYDSSGRVILVLSVLGLIILVVAAMNYVLISLSSLPLRTTSVGIHKCNGASAGSIFRMFLSETCLLVLAALLVGILLLSAFRTHIEGLLEASVYSLFTFSNLLWPGIIIGLIFFMAGFLPARVLAAVPVTQVFRSATIHQSYWKRVLLFIQITGVSFVVLLLVVVISQYHMITHKYLGYDSENMVYLPTRVLQGNTPEETVRLLTVLKNEFSRLPYVRSAATHSDLPVQGFGGYPITDKDGNTILTARSAICDLTYPEVMELEFVAGETFTGVGQILVNETFLKKAGWEENPLGRVLEGYGTTYGQIVGVVKDFPVRSLYAEQDPVFFQSEQVVPSYLTLHINALTTDYLAELNEQLNRLYPEKHLEFYSLGTTLREKYAAERKLRDIISAAFIIILLITAIGLLGYITDEILRRRKEIAIRKINGADTFHILHLLSSDISWVTLPGIILGVTGAYLAGSVWLRDFAEKISMHPIMFLTGTAVILLFIILIVSVRSWNIAREKPITNIQSE